MSDWIFPIFVFCGIAILIIRKSSIPAIASCFAYLLIAVLLRDFGHVADAVVSSHALAPAHILASWAAKAAVVCASSAALLDRGHSAASSRLCLALQSLSILLGMVWAFDAPNWGELWQWDGIETLSLCTAAALYAWSANPHNAKVPALVSLFTVIALDASLYGFGLGQDISRHAYADLSANAKFLIAAQALYFIAVAVASFLIRSKCDARGGAQPNAKNQAALYTSCFVTAGIAAITCAGIRPASPILWTSFFAIWCALSLGRPQRRIIEFASGCAIFVALALMPSRAGLVTARIDDPSVRLLGIRAEENSGSLTYTADIEAGQIPFSIRFSAVSDAVRPEGFADIRDGLRLIRFRAVDYRASTGVYLLRRDITAQRLAELLLFVAFVASLCRLIPKKPSEPGLKDADEREHEDE